MNMLIDIHLNYEVLPNMSLKQWIESDPANGRLDPLCEGRAAWWVEDNQIARIREALKPSGILIAAP
jgi:hypothetical protein